MKAAYSVLGAVPKIMVHSSIFFASMIYPKYANMPLKDMGLYG